MPIDLFERRVFKMRIKVIFDKGALDKKLNTGWGVSFLVDDKILFDTGEKGKWLVKNMRSLGIDITKIEAVVIFSRPLGSYGRPMGNTKGKKRA